LSFTPSSLNYDGKITLLSFLSIKLIITIDKPGFCFIINEIFSWYEESDLYLKLINEFWTQRIKLNKGGL